MRLKGRKEAQISWKIGQKGIKGVVLRETGSIGRRWK